VVTKPSNSKVFHHSNGKLSQFPNALALGAEHSRHVRHWIEDKKAGWYAVLEEPKVISRKDLPMLE
jgi:hypothetical protein